MNYFFQWRIIEKYSDYFYRGFFNTLSISASSISVALIFGIILAVLKRSEIKGLSWLSGSYINLIRSTPLLVQVYFVYFGLPYVNINISGYWCGVIALVLNSGAYISEIVRAGLESIPNGQIEASQSLGIDKRQTYLYIILPQALRKIIPPLIGQFTYLIKDSSILAAIGIYELTNTANVVHARTFKPIEPFVVALLGYIIIVTILMISANILKKKFSLSGY